MAGGAVVSGARYDVVVAGGGPAGVAAAIVLARAGRVVLLADAGRGPGSVGEALPAAARVLLRDLGADRVLADGHLPCPANRSAWGGPELASTDSIRDPHGHGWHLDRPRFDGRLRDRARAQGVQLAERTAVRPLARTPDGGWTVELRGPARETARCRWLLDATGRRAALARACGARTLTRDRLVAVHLTLDPADPPGADTTTTVESAPDGWWYTAPLPTGHRLLAWYADADGGDARPAGEAFAARLADTRHVGPLAAAHPWPAGGGALRRAPAHTAWLDRVDGEGWVAAGDAALAFDPLSSQGILTALFTGLRAGQAVHARLGGDGEALGGYAREVAAVRAAYLRTLRSHYAAERRWSDRPFWRDRQYPQHPQHPQRTATTTTTTTEETPV
ncbi:putative oxidoreductase [Kitasatospora setae KM-6054]|uniref:Putative oxidoreductase n=1 Tax=Kitasatospora setae (strain ATCC 33774 / DSM 43861 / JCM 3304 / KCC A-0304 / NBRC 14216 / KM-6054) TaxID=452652 RepID=E4N5H9_KITSK|nr:putative oxidoreductase [Kitasatospora setae KM-6054]